MSWRRGTAGGGGREVKAGGAGEPAGSLTLAVLLASSLLLQQLQGVGAQTGGSVCVCRAHVQRWGQAGVRLMEEGWAGAWTQK